MRFLNALALFCALVAVSAHGKPAEPAGQTEILDISQLDTPPKATERAGAVHPRELLGTSGKVLLRFTIDAKGKPRNIEVVSTDHEYFTVAAVDSLKQWRFKPGIKDGKPVVCRMQLPFNFSSHPSHAR